MRARSWAGIAVAIAVTAGLVAALASASGGRSCGEVVVSPGAAASFFSVNRVTVRGASCVSARRLVRGWATAAQQHRIPDRVIEATRHGVIGYGYPGAPYRFDGYTCRWTNTRPVHTAFLPGRGDCRAGPRTVAWTYHGQTNPTVGRVTGCHGALRWRHGDAAALRVRGVSCRRARAVVSDALAHGLLALRHGRPVVARRRFDGFVFAGDGRQLTARRGASRITFAVCWLNVDC